MPSIGRPPKTTVEFFSHDALASGGKTLSILENHFGHEGYSAWFKLLELLSATRNHFIDCRNSDSFEFLSARLKFTPEKLRLILQKMADTEAIDAALWESGIIWCQNFVDRLSEVYRRREQSLPIKPDFLLTKKDLLQAEKGLSSAETPHTREIDRLDKLDKEQLGEFKNVRLSRGEHAKLVERFGQKSAEDLIERLSCYMSSTGTTYKSHYATILNWERREKEKQPLVVKGNLEELG